ncbi:hypothetical protein RJG79_09365 [Mycoplasmatota bacterium WC44]
MKLFLELHKTRKYIVMNLVTFLVFMIIYTILDINANETYKAMIENHGIFIVFIHILINILISFVSSVVFTWSYISLSINKKDATGANIPIIGVVVGFLTFGCTPCVVAFLSLFGITFVPLILPNANLLWKLLVLLLVIFSAYITIKSANKGCKV